MDARQENRRDGGRGGPLRGPGEIAEDEAGAELARTYARLRELLGVPFVPTVYRMLGVHEQYLTAAVEAASGLLGGPAAERFAAAARRRGEQTAAELVGDAPPIAVGAQATEVRTLLARYNTANPRSLLFVCALLAHPPHPHVVMAAPAGSPPPEDEPEAILQDIRELHGGRTVPGAWREMAEIPGLLAPCWQAIRPLAGTPALARARAEIDGLARETLAGVRTPDPAALGLGAREREQIAGVLAWFTEAITVMIVEIECLRALLGPGGSQ